MDNLTLNCNEFEDLLEKKGVDYYFDMTESEEFNIETVPKTSIIRFDGIFNIPEEFDLMDLIEDYKFILIRPLDLETGEQEEIFNKVIRKDSTKIPVFFNCGNFDNRVGFSKLNLSNLRYQLVEFEDFENEEVTIIAKVLNRKEVKNTPISVFDIGKDFFSLNKVVRERMKDVKTMDVEDIKSRENVVTLEVLAIYQ